jgi:hypothetical protein
MIADPFFLALVLLVISLMLLFTALELRARDRNLRWVDERDEHIARLYEAVNILRLIPRGNPLDNLRQHGVLSRNAYQNPETIIPALDERLSALSGASARAVEEAKALQLWEQAHPAPPLHWWEAVRKPKPFKSGRWSKRNPSEQTYPTKGSVVDAPILGSTPKTLPTPVKEIEGG